MEDQKKRPAVAAEGEGETREEALERMNEEAFAAMVDANFRESEGIRLDGAAAGAGEPTAEERKEQTGRFLDRVQRRRERMERQAEKQGRI